MNPLTAEYIEAASVVLRLSAAIRPDRTRDDHMAFAGEALNSLYQDTIAGLDTYEAIKTAARQEGIN